MIAEVVLTLACISQAACTIVALRTVSAAQRRHTHAIVAKTPQEFAMLEKMATHKRLRPTTKTERAIPYGL